MRFGNYDCQIFSDGLYLLDGGAMFGVVPKVLWQRQHPADESNRIELALNCLLVRGEDRVVLVDTGMGQLWSEREIDLYGLQRPEGDLVEALARAGVQPEDVTDLILTHLHFDHAGGMIHPDGSLVFKQATHWVQAQHLRWAKDPTERDRRSFRADILEAIESTECDFRAVDGATQILPGIEVLPVHGHTPGQQLVLIGEPGAARLLYAADLVPYASQLHLPWLMAFDLNPLLTLEEKRELLSRAVFEEWVLVFEHDLKTPAAKVIFDSGRYRVGEEVQLGQAGTTQTPDG
ncbi:MBL fold metallo-hydrolase [bacterium]|nr:MAG: MBL fold metallo-hydrolase [bacterium]